MKKGGTFILIGGKSLNQLIAMPPESPSTNRKRCPKCGSSFTGEPVFCKNCGACILTVSSRQNTEESSNNAKGVYDLLNEGIKLASNRNYRGAIQKYDRALAIKPDDADAWYFRGLALGELGRHAELGQYAEAVVSFDKAIAINPDFAEAWYNRGLALGELGRHAEALASFDKAIAINPDYTDARKNREIILQQQEKKLSSSSFDRFGKSKEVDRKPKTDFVQNPPSPWNKGYKILNRYEIVDIKKGGMGIVYIAHDNEWDLIFAIKTFQDKYLWDEDVIQRFMAEAETWTKLEKHTNLVFAIFIRRIEGKPLLFLEYIDSGDLEQFIGNLSIEESLDFAIQFCSGMEYAYQKLGVIHRDIKPGNVMVQKDPRFRFGYAFKITDFGLVKVLGDKFRDEFVEISTGMGTLPFMPPEQFPDRIQEKFSFKGQVTTRSDIYSFGMTLYLLLTGKLPFSDLNEIFTKNPENPKNLNQKIPKRLDLLIIKCLEKNPDKRYIDFTELKEKLVEIYNDLTAESYAIVGKKVPLTNADWGNKGVALAALGKLQEAIGCYDKLLEINPRDDKTWNNKGNALDTLGKHQEAIECYDKSLEINPRDAAAWCNKGDALDTLGKHQEAIGCYDKALGINSRLNEVWSNKGKALHNLGKPQEAIGCYDKSLEINPREDRVWSNKGSALNDLGKHQDAFECYDKSLEINPKNTEVWNNKGVALYELGKPQEAIGCYDKSLEINPRYFKAWSNKGNALDTLGKHQEAIECYDKSLEINPRYFEAWSNKGVALAALGKPQEAIGCYDKSLEINPRAAMTWSNKGIALDSLGKLTEAIGCYDKSLEINPRDSGAWYNKGNALAHLGKPLEAIGCFDKSLGINPRYAVAWYNKGGVLIYLGKTHEAIGCFEKFIVFTPPEYASKIEQAKQIINQLRG